MKVIYNKFIPFKGYKAMNLFISNKCKRCCGYSTTYGMQSST